jgi:hypothetical protein
VLSSLLGRGGMQWFLGPFPALPMPKRLRIFLVSQQLINVCFCFFRERVLYYSCRLYGRVMTNTTFKITLCLLFILTFHLLTLSISSPSVPCSLVHLDLKISCVFLRFPHHRVSSLFVPWCAALPHLSIIVWLLSMSTHMF